MWVTVLLTVCARLPYGMSRRSVWVIRRHKQKKSSINFGRTVFPVVGVLSSRFWLLTKFHPAHVVLSLVLGSQGSSVHRHPGGSLAPPRRSPGRITVRDTANVKVSSQPVTQASSSLEPHRERRTCLYDPQHIGR
ncbi:hypothetical protein BGW80DRAFT_876581 [Lactifluus volemus]|nr:hypothetical protein BGW80DRAFT_876581 [Lactifluus volemus]